MAKLISVSEEAYERLSAIKSREKAKSFTQVILELIGKKKTGIEDLFGKLQMSDKEADRLKERIKLGRKNLFKKSD
jgi:predicted CopG family antitoxin